MAVVVVEIGLPSDGRGGGGGGVDVTPTGFPSFSREWEKLIFSCKLILGTSVHEKIFQIGSTVLDLKLDKGRVLRVATYLPLPQLNKN